MDLPSLLGHPAFPETMERLGTTAVIESLVHPDDLEAVRDAMLSGSWLTPEEKRPRKAGKGRPPRKGRGGWNRTTVARRVTIEKIELFLCRLPLVHFFETSFGRSYDRTFVLIRVEGYDVRISPRVAELMVNARNPR